MSGANRLPWLQDDEASAQLKLERSSLRDQAKDLLRNHIVGGRIAPGTKLVERELAESLGISRAPVRDALIELEKKGLVVTKPSGRYVIELGERDVRELYQVRLALEMLAAELATQHISPGGHTDLLANLQKMREAVAKKDLRAFTDSDVETHRHIWQMTDNIYLLRALNSMVGPIFMFVARHAEHDDWNETLELHADLADCIGRGDSEAAKESIRRHLDNALHRSLRAFARM